MAEPLQESEPGRGVWGYEQEDGTLIVGGRRYVPSWERDRYREALESFAAWGADGDPRWEHVRMFAKEALDG